MDSRELLIIINLKTIQTRLILSIEDIKENNPKRVDLIKPMQESLNDLNIGIAELQSLTTKTELLQAECSALRIERENNQSEIIKLRKTIESLMKHATL